MKNTSDFLAMINAVMAIDTTENDLDLPLVELENWDSIDAVRLMNRLEKTWNIHISMVDYLQATTLRELYELIRSTVE